MKRYKIDLEKSEISWTGFQPTNDISGKIFFKGGAICADQGKISEAEFIIDMQSIQVTDQKLPKEEKNKLTGHLKSSDFFNTDIYPHAIVKTIDIQTVDPEELDTNIPRVTNPSHEVNALLTIKDITHEIKFPIKIIYVNNHLKADAQFTIDRIQWGIDFMKEESYKEKKIKPDLLFKVSLTAEGIDEIDV
jgi:polyisoprenoid-binding protein YceI